MQFKNYQYKLNYFFQTISHLAQNQKIRDFFAKEFIYKSTSQIDIININYTILQLKTILPLITLIAKKRGKIWFISPKNPWYHGALSNIKVFKKKKKIPNFICLLEKKEAKEHSNEIRTIHIPFYKAITSSMDIRHPIYPLSTNTRPQTFSFQKNLIDTAIIQGYIQERHVFSKRRFPRLGSNQRPRT